MTYIATPRSTSPARTMAVSLTSIAIAFFAFFGAYRFVPVAVTSHAPNASAVLLSTTFSKQVPSAATPWLWLNDTDKQRYVPPICDQSTLARLGGSVAALSFTTDELTVQGRSAVCTQSPRDPNGRSVNNGEQDEREKIQMMIASGAIPNTAQTVPGLVDVIKTDGFDVDLYLKESNPKERQHRLLCMLEASEAPIEAGAADPALARLVANKDKWIPVLQQQQADCGAALNADMGSGPPPDLRGSLRNFTDAEAASMLQCRAKASDTRTLFEVRDFMCLHRNRLTRDIFYTKLQGNAVQMLDAERYQVFTENSAGTLQDLEARKTADAMYNLKKTLNMIAEKDGEIQNITSTISG